MDGSRKCLVWDLDNTLWQGVLIEDGEVRLRLEAAELVQTLDARGVLQSIASRGDGDLAMQRLRKFELAEYFLHPQVNWDAKSKSIEAIASALRIVPEAIAFIDDQEFEREEVRARFPGILCLDAANLTAVGGLPELTPAAVTSEARLRLRIARASTGEIWIAPRS